MSLEMGGRADKYGNQYENRYLARLLLRLVNEEIGSVIVEPLGADSDSVEFISEHEGTKEYYQCKASNTDHDSWTIADLRRYQWPRSESEARELTPQQYRWLMEGLKVDQPRAHRDVTDIRLG